MAQIKKSPKLKDFKKKKVLRRSHKKTSSSPDKQKSDDEEIKYENQNFEIPMQIMEMPIKVR